MMIRPPIAYSGQHAERRYAADQIAREQTVGRLSCRARASGGFQESGIGEWGKVTIPGFDVSDNNGPSDWPAAAKEQLAVNPAAFVAVKTNENDYTSKLLHQQRMGAHAAGFRYVILYDFARFDLCSGRAEAERFLADIGDDGGLLLNEGVALDLEVLAQRPDLSNADLRAYVLDWVNTVAPVQSPPLTVILYSSVEQLRAFHMFEEPSPLHDPRIVLWLVNLGGTTAPAVPFGRVVMIQTDWYGRVAGFQGNVDLDLFLGTEAELKALTWGNQVDPLGGKSATGTPDLDKSTPVLAVVKHAITKLEQSPPDVPTAIADLAQWVDTLGLVGS